MFQQNDINNNADATQLATHVCCHVKGGCGSSDGMAVYYYPHNKWRKYKLFCYACGNFQFIDEPSFEALNIPTYGDKYDDKFKYKKVSHLNSEHTSNHHNHSHNTELWKGEPRPDRGLTADTFSKFKASTQVIAGTDNISKHIYPYYDINGNLIAQKVRHILDEHGNEIPKGPDTFKTYGEKGSWQKITLFGQNVFPAGSAHKLTITEGEVDAMSVFQMLGSKYPVVSISNGAQTIRKLLENIDIYKYLDSFDELIVCMDADSAGFKAAETMCEVFPHKSKIVPLSYKDANEYLMAGKTLEFSKDWWKAKPYQPAGLALSSEFIKDVVDGTVAKGAIPYPHKELNRKLFGMRQAEMTCWVAGTGSGKSTMIRELVNHIKLLTPVEERIGMLMLEESPNKTMTGLTGLQMSKPLLLYDLDQQLPKDERILTDLVITREEREKAATEMLGDDRFVIMRNSFQGADLDNIVKKVRQMSKVYGCKHIVLDHISIIVSGQDQGDERKALDAITTNLRRLTEETGINLHIVSHLKRPDGKGFEDGAEISLSDIRGTGAIAQLSDNVIGLERNQQHEDPYLKNVIRFRCLKCRVTGLTGVAGYGYYNHKTGRIEILTNEEYENQLSAFEEKQTIKEEKRKDFKNHLDFPHDM